MDKTICSSLIGLFGWWWINVNTSHGNSTYYVSVIIERNVICNVVFEIK